MFLSTPHPRSFICDLSTMRLLFWHCCEDARKSLIPLQGAAQQAPDAQGLSEAESLRSHPSPATYELCALG